MSLNASRRAAFTTRSRLPPPTPSMLWCGVIVCSRFLSHFTHITSSPVSREAAWKPHSAFLRRAKYTHVVGNRPAEPQRARRARGDCLAQGPSARRGAGSVLVAAAHRATNALSTTAAGVFEFRRVGATL